VAETQDIILDLVPFDCPQQLTGSYVLLTCTNSNSNICIVIVLIWTDK